MEFEGTSGHQPVMVETIHPTAQNNGQPMDNVGPEWQLDQLKTSLAFYVIKGIGQG